MPQAYQQLRRTRRNSAIRSCLLLVAAIAAAAPTLGLAAPGREIRFKVIDGQPCVRCTITGPKGSIPANVVIDLGLRVPVLAHERTAGLLGVSREAPLQVQVEGLTLTDLPVRAMGLEALENLSREHAAELGEIPAVAVLGLSAFAKYTPQIEIGEGVLRLLPPSALDTSGTESDVAAPAQADSSANAEDCTLKYEAEAHSYWLTGAGPEGFRLKVRFTTGGYDTTIDATVADMLGAPGGDLDNLYVGPINVARIVALRPQDLSSLPAPRPDLVLGTNLLASFRVTIDTAHETMRFERTREASFPSEERECFVAMANDDAPAIEKFVQDHPDSRLAREAAERLVTLLLNASPAVPESIARAMRLQVSATRPQRRAEAMIMWADGLLESSREDRLALASEALRIGLEHAPDDQNSRAPHEIFARLGRIALQNGDLREARRNLLSAAFGMPRDPIVNALLGELYERLGKTSRAWSRFAQAAMVEKPPRAALEGLDRLNRDPEFRAGFSMADAEELLEGRVPEFHPAVVYKPEPGGEGVPVQLVELFTCVDNAATHAAELAFCGLAEYLDAAGTACVEYHIAAPNPDPLVSPASKVRAAFYGAQSTPVVYFDGGNPATLGGDEDAVQQVFSAYRAAVIVPAAERAWAIEGRATLSGTKIDGEFAVTGPAGGDGLGLHVLLVERAVMAPGSNVVLMHRHVARAVLSPADGFAIAAGPGRRVFAVDGDVGRITASLEQAISAVEAERGITFLTRPTFVDGVRCKLIAVLQERSTKRVLAARAIPIARVAPESPTP